MPKPKRKPISFSGRKPSGPAKKKHVSNAELAAQMFGTGSRKKGFVPKSGTGRSLKIPAKKLPGGGATANNPLAALAVSAAAGQGGLIGNLKVKKSRPSESVGRKRK